LGHTDPFVKFPILSSFATEIEFYVMLFVANETKTNGSKGYPVRMLDTDLF